MHIHPKSLSRYFAFQFLYRFFLDNFSSSLHEILQSDKNTKEEDLHQLINEFAEGLSIHDDEQIYSDFSLKVRSISEILIFGVINQYQKLVDTLKLVLIKRNIEKVEKIELTLLLLGTYELKNTQDTDKKIIINEYIELAKKFGPVNSPSFINGVLDKVAKTHTNL
ncbi:MAG: transcription antitermination factor NusB [Halobacteriovoraceae bacterium]|nr:transcription antitermination factor NusB [Halobacteriovoraceae bacterium]